MIETLPVHDPWADLARRLVGVGVWPDPLGPEAIAQQRAISEGASPWQQPVFDEVCFRADGEDLAEGQVESLLAEMAPVAARHGLALDVETVELASDRYAILINGRMCEIRGAPHPWDWMYSTLRPMLIVNDLLAEAGATVRVHVMSAGTNDGRVLLVTPEVVDLVRGSELYPPAYEPVLVHRGSIAEFEAQALAAHAELEAWRAAGGTLTVVDVTAQVVYGGGFLNLVNSLAASPGNLSKSVLHFLTCDDLATPTPTQASAVLAQARLEVAAVIGRSEDLEEWLLWEARSAGIAANAAVLAALEAAADPASLAEAVVIRYADRYDVGNIMRYFPYDPDGPDWV